ncbi:hypothetical protein B9T19_05065 [Ignatzschineria sp. F8392]|uniref:hypothetical protein n=1 Tax=Ignatzschineria sp. F8392 TaxID=1980117 RepID=UPI000B9965BB|nr:hypothetical protein [Ignatzschineria sp. F8392]OYQ80613.1 hypothetical protein B9T19_05065 [Ignatzschineria sp. F8392]
MPANIVTLTINHLEIKSRCVAGPHYRALPEVARRQKDIKDANQRACTGKKSDIVGSRRSTDSLKNHKIIY